MNALSKKTAALTILPLRAAIYHAVHDQRGGVGAVAGALGFNANTLQHKINPNSDRHNLSLSDFELLLGYTRDGRLMDSLCAVFGNAVWIDLGKLGAGSDAGMIRQLGDVSAAVGDLARSVAAALDDGVVSHDEVALLEKQTLRLVQAAESVLALARRMEEQGHV